MKEAKYDALNNSTGFEYDRNNRLTTTIMLMETLGRRQIKTPSKQRMNTTAMAD